MMLHPLGILDDGEVGGRGRGLTRFDKRLAKTLSDTDSNTKPDLTLADPPWLRRFVKAYPQAPLILPFMTFLLLMLPDRMFDESFRTYTYAARTLASLYVAWMFRRHFPPLGKLHLHIAIPVGLLVAVGWVEVHHIFAGCSHQPCHLLGLLGIEHHYAGFEWYKEHLLFDDGNAFLYFVPHDHYESGVALWSFLIIRIGGAATAVPIVEELFWRAFILRLLINRHRFDEVPLAKFTLFSFVACSLLSAVQHQPQWEVGILCWMVYNALFYWKKSLACCMVTHGVTNLALYIYVYNAQDWRFW